MLPLHVQGDAAFGRLADRSRCCPLEGTRLRGLTGVSMPCECEQACAALPDCLFFTFWPFQGRCSFCTESQPNEALVRGQNVTQCLMSKPPYARNGAATWQRFAKASVRPGPAGSAR